MINERGWDMESLIRLLLGVILCMCAAVLIHTVVVTPEMAQTSAGRFLGFVINTGCLHVGILFVVHRFLKQQSIGWSAGFGLNKNGWGRAIVRGMVIGLLIAPLVMALQAGCHWLFTQAEVKAPRQEVVTTLVQTVQWDQRIYFGFIAIVIAPVVEEIMFRGVMYPALKYRGYGAAAVWGSAIIFAMMHGNLLSLIPLTLLGLLLIALYEWSGNLLTPIFAHSTFNAVNFALITFGQQWLKEIPGAS
ncbi:MAG: hypothetical protein CMO80_04415 [Verrucomicrobiales bacterium]|nr:hypothetical protein [Verrucomicrobiales bacterium]